MKNLRYMIMLLSLSLWTMETKAQFVVSDPGSLVQSILNYAQHIASAGNTLENLAECQKIFDQGKVYYDALQNVHGIIKNGRKVQESIQLSVQVIDEYGKTYSRLAGESYFTSYQLDVYNRQQSNIMQGMASVIDDVTKIVTNTGMSLSDKERLDALDESHSRIVSLFNKSRGLNMQMEGECDAVKAKKARRRMERDLLR